MLSNYSKIVAQQHKLKTGKSQKLISNLCKKEKYIIHERNLKQAVDAGLIVTKIHRVLEFDQKPWMKKYINFNTHKRKLSKNEFEKDFFKLMNNAVFGKTMENLRKRQNIKLISDVGKLLKYVSKPGFVNSKIFNENLAAVHNVKEMLVLDKPIYVGFGILDLSKWLMYDFHYGYIKNKYDNNAQLLFTDTDSLCYELKTEDFYQDMFDNRTLFDLSDIKAENSMTGKFKDDSNKKVIRVFKPELVNFNIKEFIGLISKMYSLLLEKGAEKKTIHDDDNNIEDEVEKKTAKGVIKSVLKKELKHENYRNIL